MSSPIQQAIQKVKDQIGTQNYDEVYVLEIESIPFIKISSELKALFEKCSSLQMLVINNCDLNTLENFPNLPSLIRLDLVANKLTGDNLAALSSIRHLQTAYLSCNNIETISDLDHLAHFKKLFQLDLIGNKICQVPNYEQIVFNKFPSLQLLDGLDNKGQQYDKNQIQETIKRVSVNLFEQVVPQQRPPQRQQQQLVRRLTSSNSFAEDEKDNQIKKKNSMQIDEEDSEEEQKLPQKKPPKKPQNTKPQQFVAPKSKAQGKMGGKAKGKGQSFSSRVSQSSKAGLTFPVGRIGRYLKRTKMFSRMSKGSAIYMAAILEYLTAEIVELAGNAAKSNKRQKIQPKHVSVAIKTDPELSKFFNDLVIRDGGFTHMLINKKQE